MEISQTQVPTPAVTPSSGQASNVSVETTQPVHDTPAKATGTAGRLRSGVKVPNPSRFPASSISSPFVVPGESDEMCVRGWAEAPGSSKFALSGRGRGQAPPLRFKAKMINRSLQQAAGGGEF